MDNYGDAAVCWRLSRQLATEHGASVRLWIDDPATLRALRPDVAESGVAVRHWHPEADFGATADVAVDAFADGLPESYARAMAGRARPSLWIKLEYLSAEAWVEDYHGRASPPPSLAVPRYFFFPGFTERTGGLLREAGLFARRDAFVAADFWAALGFDAPQADACVVSLFGYRNPALRGLLRAWSEGTQQVVLAVTDCPLRAEVSAFIGESYSRGNLQVRFLPFLAQSRYDELLWASDWNFVRGEDSFLRAQWAAKPFVWQIYPQAEDAHRPKLEAFLERYERGLDPRPGALWRAWNGYGGDIADAWRALMARHAALAGHAGAWAAGLGVQSDLASRLAQFCRNLLK